MVKNYKNEKVAVVGMGGVYPNCSNLEDFWTNIRDGKDLSEESLAERWVADKADIKATFAKQPDKLTNTRGYFVKDWHCDSTDLDIDQRLLDQLDPVFHLTLKAAKEAFFDSKWETVDRARTGVVFGNIVLPTAKSSELAREYLYSTLEEYIFGESHQDLQTNPLNHYVAGLPAQILHQALGLGGGSYTLDAACASSLYAIKSAMDELLSGRMDTMLTGGVSRPDSLYTQMGFTQLTALSKKGKSRPFDSEGDGLVVGEGAGFFVLKRLTDAQRDGDKIYGVLCGVGVSNDLNGGLMAPDTEGQLRAMHDAYEAAGWDPTDVDMIECHATGTPLGDRVEMTSLKTLWQGAAHSNSCVLGSVKANVGHLLTAAGASGLSRILYAMQNELYPPTANFVKGSEQIALEDSPFKVLQKAEPWKRRGNSIPRRAALSGFGFGGINAHVLIEEYMGQKVELKKDAQPQKKVAVVGIKHLGDHHLKDKHPQFSCDDVCKISNHYGNWNGIESSRWVKEYLPNVDFKAFKAIDSIYFPINKFRIPPVELNEMLPQQLLMLLASSAALEEAGYSREEKVHSGVFIGLSLDGMTNQFNARWGIPKKLKSLGDRLDLASLSEDEVEKIKDMVNAPLTANRTMGALGGVVASRIAREFQFGGAGFTVSQEEQSAMRAFEVGYRSIANGDLNMALVGAVHFDSQFEEVLVNKKLGVDQSGINVKDHAVALVLKSLDDAKKDGNHIYGVVNEPLFERSVSNQYNNDLVSVVEEYVEGAPFFGVESHHHGKMREIEIKVGKEAFSKELNLVLKPKPETQQPQREHIEISAGGDVVSVPTTTYQSQQNLGSSMPNRMNHIFEGVSKVIESENKAHSTFLKTQDDLMLKMGELLSKQMQNVIDPSEQYTYETPAVGSYNPEIVPAVPGSFEQGVTKRVPLSDEKPWLDFEACQEFARGSVGNVLGADFAAIDAHPTRVRLPDGPLLLCHRIMSVDAPRLELGSGTLVTEHDVFPDAWYLDHGKIPTCIAVEAGQADLFLSGYMGIDYHSKGELVYRLLDAKVTFFRDLPEPGDIIRYKIHISEFFNQGETTLFRFGFKATVNDELLMTMSEGCAGFFSQKELDDGKGIVLSTMDKKPIPGKYTGGFEPLINLASTAYTESQLDALRRGDYVGCFGEKFSGLKLQNPGVLPGGKMRLVHRIASIENEGGKYGLGRVVGEADIRPDDWFLTCHFVDDMVMPGTLMYECCLHTLRVYLMHIGWVGEAEELVFEPMIKAESKLKCRGQVLQGTELVTYEIIPKEMGYDDASRPYAICDALMYADGKLIVEIANMTTSLRSLTKEKLEALWQSSSSSAITSDKKFNFGQKKAIFGPKEIKAYTEGNPSDAFGGPYKIFDSGDRKIARLPRDPFCFVDRVTDIQAEQWKVQSGGSVEIQYDVPSDAWYFDAENQGRMPFSVLLETALQPCGWYSAYMGSALTSEENLYYRNLGGSATQYLPIERDIGTITTQVQSTKVSISGGMVIQEFDFQLYAKGQLIYSGQTVFGFFSKAALAQQVGVRGAKPYYLTDEFQQREHAAIEYPSGHLLPREPMNMMDKIEAFDLDGGSKGLGYICGSKKVNPAEWFYEAHFYQDPVMPGSLGLESFVQLLKVVAGYHWGSGDLTVLESPALNVEHSWLYRGQVLPTNKEVIVEAEVLSIDHDKKVLEAKGFLMADGLVIYEIGPFSIKVK